MPKHPSRGGLPFPPSNVLIHEKGDSQHLIKVVIRSDHDVPLSNVVVSTDMPGLNRPPCVVLDSSRFAINELGGRGNPDLLPGRTMILGAKLLLTAEEKLRFRGEGPHGKLGVHWHIRTTPREGKIAIASIHIDGHSFYEEPTVKLN